MLINASRASALLALFATHALFSATAGAVQDYASAKYRILSAPDCVDASHMISEFAPAPINDTYMRVQHIGDPGTPELEGEVANLVTWNVGQLTGFFPPVSSYGRSQRGYQNVGPPNGSSAFQLWCNGAGFYINTPQFSHSMPLDREGPSASVARDLSPAPAVFRNSTSELTIDAYVRVPTVQYGLPPTTGGTVQVSFMYYVKDVTTGTTFAHTIGLFDNRSPGVGGSATESVSADAYTAFVESPLRPIDSTGNPTQYVNVSPYSDVMHFNVQWAGPSLFQVHVPYEKFRAMLVRLKNDSLPNISIRPEDYRVTLFGLLGEVLPGTGTNHEVALGASVTDLRLSEAYDVVSAVQVVEYYRAALDHYFMSSLQAEIDALDSGRLSGWARTGKTFMAYPSFVVGTSPVCRFYLPPVYGNSHFFSASDVECRGVASTYPNFVLEHSAVMYIALPDISTGACPTNSTPVYRLWNNRPDTNHRYTTDAMIKQQMLTLGWVAEGYGSDSVAMCAAGP